MEIRGNKNQRESWFVRNLTNKNISIGDLLLLPTIKPGKQIDLLQFYSREEVSHSTVLTKLSKSGKIQLIKQKRGESKEIISSDLSDKATSPAEEDALLEIQSAIENSNNSIYQLLESDYVTYSELNDILNPEAPGDPLEEPPISGEEYSNLYFVNPENPSLDKIKVSYDIINNEIDIYGNVNIIGALRLEDNIYVKTNNSIYFGDTHQSSIYYSGTNLVLFDNVVGGVLLTDIDSLISQHLDNSYSLSSHNHDLEYADISHTGGNEHIDWTSATSQSLVCNTLSLNSGDIFLGDNQKIDWGNAAIYADDSNNLVLDPQDGGGSGVVNIETDIKIAEDKGITFWLYEAMGIAGKIYGSDLSLYITNNQFGSSENIYIQASGEIFTTELKVNPSLNASGQGLTIQPSLNGTGDASIIGAYFNVTGSTTEQLSGICCRLRSNVSGDATSLLKGLLIDLIVSSDFDSIHNIKIVDVDTILSTVETQYGLYIDDLETATNNYAIYTGLGDVRFGDYVSIEDNLLISDTDWIGYDYGLSLMKKADSGIMTAGLCFVVEDPDTSAGGVSHLWGTMGYVYLKRNNNITNVTGLSGYVMVSDTFSGDTNTIKGLTGSVYHYAPIASPLGIGVFSEAIISNGTMTEYSMYSGSVSASSTVTNLYGLKLPSISGGTSENYAIYTELGKVRFGDDVYILTGNSIDFGDSQEASISYNGVDDRLDILNKKIFSNTGLWFSDGKGVEFNILSDVGTKAKMYGLDFGDFYITNNEFGFSENIVIQASGNLDVQSHMYVHPNFTVSGKSGLSITPNATLGATSGSITGAYFNVVGSSDNQITGICCRLKGLLTGDSTSTLKGLLIDPNLGSDFDLYTAIQINNISTPNSLNTQHGILINDLDAATENYAIKTGLGKVRFGDDVYINNNSIYFGDTQQSSIYYDGTNLVLSDNVIGELTLSDLTKPKLIKIISTANSEGGIHLSDVSNWNVSKAIIKEIIIDTVSTDWDLYILQNDNGYVVDDAVVSKRQITSSSSEYQDIILDMFYEDEDNSNEVHLYWVDNSGTNTVNITVLGVEAR